VEVSPETAELGVGALTHLAFHRGGADAVASCGHLATLLVPAGPRKRRLEQAREVGGDRNHFLEGRGGGAGGSGSGEGGGGGGGGGGEVHLQLWCERTAQDLAQLRNSRSEPAERERSRCSKRALLRSLLPAKEPY